MTEKDKILEITGLNEGVVLFKSDNFLGDSWDEFRRVFTKVEERGGRFVFLRDACVFQGVEFGSDSLLVPFTDQIALKNIDCKVEGAALRLRDGVLLKLEDREEDESLQNN